MHDASAYFLKIQVLSALIAKIGQLSDHFFFFYILYIDMYIYGGIVYI
jgi:hypothetical protein